MIKAQRQGNRVCLFLRVSSDKQSYARQLTELSSYCDTKSYEIVHTIATVISGRVRHHQREDVQELLMNARSNKFDKVVVTEVSRLGRNAADIKYILDTLHGYGVSVVFKNLGIESLENGVSTFAVSVILAIYAEVCQEETRILSERIRSGLNHARQTGKKLGRPEGSMSDQELLKKYPRLVEDINRGISIRKCEKIHDVSARTVIKVKKCLEIVKL